MRKWDLNSGLKKGQVYLEYVSLVNYAVRKVASRFNLKRSFVFNLVEVYLERKNISPQAMEHYKNYVLNGFLTDKGFQVVAAVMFAIRNRLDYLREEKNRKESN